MYNKMLEIKNMFNVEEEVFLYLQDYIKNNYSIDTKVSDIVLEKHNPLVVVEEDRNDLVSRSTTYDRTKRALSYSINIFCSKRVDSKKIVKELSVLVCNVMQNHFKMKGGLIGIIPMYDDPNTVSYQAIIRFTTNYIPSENKIY